MSVRLDRLNGCEDLPLLKLYLTEGTSKYLKEFLCGEVMTSQSLAKVVGSV